MVAKGGRSPPGRLSFVNNPGVIMHEYIAPKRHDTRILSKAPVGPVRWLFKTSSGRTAIEEDKSWFEARARASVRLRVDAMDLKMNGTA